MDDYVPIPVECFQKAYATVLHAMSGTLTLAPGTIIEPKNGNPIARAVFIGGLLFSNPEEKKSFYWRVATVLPIALEKTYRKYRSDDGQALHIALLRAVCTVTGSMRTTKRALRAALVAEFQRQLARVAGGNDAALH